VAPTAEGGQKIKLSTKSLGTTKAGVGQGIKKGENIQRERREMTMKVKSRKKNRREQTIRNVKALWSRSRFKKQTKGEKKK